MVFGRGMPVVPYSEVLVMNRSDFASPRHEERRKRFSVKYRKTLERTKFFNAGTLTAPDIQPYKTHTWVRVEPKPMSRRDKWRSR